ncbi:DUF4189 domain-containing protein [Stenotrophomonas maltophilia]
MRMIHLLAPMVFMFATSALEAQAEGRCPPGQYPIGGQGVGGCAPIPGGEGTATSGPRATGKWIKTWGAISLAPSGASGSSTGRVRKTEAVEEAQRKCAESGGVGCKVTITYKNQCVAAVVASSGTDGTTQFGTGATIESAKEFASRLCASKGGSDCAAVYAACSEPIFEKF